MFAVIRPLLLLLVCCLLVSLSACDSAKTAVAKPPVQVVDEQDSSLQQAESTEASDATGSGATDSNSKGSAGSETKPPTTSETVEPAAENAKGFDVVVADGAITLKAPGTWENVKPRFNMIEAEIKIPKSEGEGEDEKDGRLTIMGAMGSVEANLQRWYGQYSQPDGGDTAEAAEVTKQQLKGCEVTFVDIKGTLLDRPGGPMAGGKLVERENYRTLAAIVQTGELGQYFIKLYGPGKTIGDNEEAFKSFVESMAIDAEKEGL